ncbi:MAG: hypothetical protein HOQ36_20610 [Nocardia sp.]|nr:hypothetical protein [Nocardia sp.]
MTPHDAVHIRARHSAHVPADRSPAPGAAADTDPLVATVRRIRGFLLAGWRFQTGLAGRLPGLYLSGGAL